MAALQAGPSSQPQQHKESYDYDLFRKDKKVWFFNAEYLYWTASEPNLDYALKMDQPAWTTTANVYANGDVKHAQFEWDSGLRFNIGYFNAPHYWDAYLQYTWLHNTGHNETRPSGGANEFLTGTWPHPTPGGTLPLDEAHSDLKLNYNVGDFLASRRYHPNPHFRMRMIGGITAAWMEHTWKLHYRDTTNQKSHIRNRWSFKGAGLRSGLTLDWYLGKTDIYLTGGASAAVLAGQYHNSSKQTSTFAGANFDPSIPMRDIHYQDTRLTLTGQILAGPSWQKAFSCCRTELFAGYELTVWSNLHEIYRSTHGLPQDAKETWQSNGMLVLQGLTVRWNLDF